MKVTEVADRGNSIIAYPLTIFPSSQSHPLRFASTVRVAAVSVSKSCILSYGSNADFMNMTMSTDSGRLEAQ